MELRYIPLPHTVTHLNYLHPANLAQWGYSTSTVGSVYRNLATGGFWGIADLLRHIGSSDKFEEEGGSWKGVLITHYQPPRKSDVPIENQWYRAPDGSIRRVRISVSLKRTPSSQQLR